MIVGSSLGRVLEKVAVPFPIYLHFFYPFFLSSENPEFYSVDVSIFILLREAANLLPLWE